MVLNMKASHRSGFLALGLLVGLAFSAEAKDNELNFTLDAEDAAALAEHIGQTVEVVGKVASVGRGAAGELIFLNLTARPDGFSAALVPSVHEEIGDPEDYLGQRVKVRGLLLSHKGTPQIKVSRLSQIETIPN